ncbi:TadE/TadG family type IV pilus assembly protein [Pelistega ratti]|uniref:TadE/TadG family type IV pilus assembly protein n=1 Tax=Pelistega ratti TaxID=2652177 RepID=UPI0013571D71|nr:TadE family protein [Pelistega ratti]
MSIFTLSHHKGMAGIEFILTAIPILLLGLGGYEFTRWYNTRHLLNIALAETARQASMAHANPETIEATFEKAINPLFASGTQTEQRRQRYLHHIQTTLQNTPWQIHILNPTPAHFLDFQRKDLQITQQTGYAAIDNNYQKEQYQRQGIGTFSGEDIFAANVLTLSLIYPYKPIVPGIASLFKWLSPSQTDTYAHQIMEKGFLPMKHTFSIHMQSHPVQWPSLHNGKVLSSGKAHTIPSGKTSVDTCLGIWCQSPKTPLSSTIPSKKVKFEEINTHHPTTTHQPIATKQHHSLPVETKPPYTESIPSQQNHPLCGTTLCCS